MFRLPAAPEDDTIFLSKMCISSDVHFRSGVGSTGADFLLISYGSNAIFRLLLREAFKK